MTIAARAALRREASPGSEMESQRILVGTGRS
jgi:hypothetical protein